MQADVEFVDLHLAHATSAFYTSGFDSAVAVTVDGGGDGCSSHIYVVQDDHFRQVARTKAFHSIDNYYSYVTQISDGEGFHLDGRAGVVPGMRRRAIIDVPAGSLYGVSALARALGSLERESRSS